jgi:hypothetical protein
VETAVEEPAAEALTGAASAFGFLVFFSTVAEEAVTTGAVITGVATCSVSVLDVVFFAGILLYYILGFTF